MFSTHRGAPPSWRVICQKAVACIIVIGLGALLFYRQELIDWYAGAPRGDELLFCAVGSGTPDDIDRALSQGANINARNVSGLTPLMLAAGAKNPSVVRAMLDRHADPKLEADTGVTALFEAVVADDPEVIDMLVDAGANPSQTTGGESLIDLAKRLDRPRSLSALEARRARARGES